MVQQVQVYLFGDQTYDVNSRLRDLLLVKGNPILTTFFEQAYFVIRAEIGRLPVKESGAFPKFTCLGDILARQREGGLNPAFQTPLTTIYQLGSFIR
jgi:naphtho-gamma-pyrone polyketide synthase